MKKIFLLFVLFLSTITCFSQDIVTFVNGKSVKAKVMEVTQTEIKYRLFNNMEGPLYTKSLSSVFSITYSTGYTEKIVHNNVTINSEQKDRIRRLKVWSKILKIYGWVNFTSGACLVVFNGSLFHDSYEGYDVEESRRILRTIGYVGMGEGAITMTVGYGLQGKYELLMKEYNLVGSVPVLQKEFKFDNCTIAPSVNMLSYRNNPLEGVGAGLKISF